MAECFIHPIILSKNVIGDLKRIAEIRNGGAGGAFINDGFLNRVSLARQMVWPIGWFKHLEKH